MSEVVKPSQVRFPPRGAFSRELDGRVAAYFEESGRDRRDLPGMYAKSAIILTWFVGSWALLVFVAHTFWVAALLAVSLGLSIAGIGMSVQHDANHGGYSSRGWVNRIFGCTLDVMGVCSFIWRQKHNIAHHTFTNVAGIDYDLDFGVLARLSPEQRRRPWHRFQHLYLWMFYGFLLPKWVFHDDFIILRKRFIGVHKLPAPNRAKLVAFVGWKLFFVAWAIVIPAMFHPIWQVALFHAIAVFTLGLSLGTVFQLAHCNDVADYPAVGDDARMTEDWASHQLATTVDFAPNSALITWFVGGLNFQVEHHLFPKVCHLHYPALALIVDDVAQKHGLRHRQQATFRGALSSHFRHLRALGLPVAERERRHAAVPLAFVPDSRPVR
jgi:linoleoyl-CoA desaturase